MRRFPSWYRKEVLCSHSLTSKSPCSSRNTSRLKATTTTEGRASRMEGIIAKTVTACTCPSERAIWLKFNASKNRSSSRRYTDHEEASGSEHCCSVTIRRGKLVYAGSFVTGFDQDRYASGRKLARLETAVSSFCRDGLPRRGCTGETEAHRSNRIPEGRLKASCDTLDSSACG